MSSLGKWLSPMVAVEILLVFSLLVIVRTNNVLERKSTAIYIAICGTLCEFAAYLLCYGKCHMPFLDPTSECK